MAYEARIETDSISEAGRRLTTMVVTFPRMVLAEFNTHRVFSRNSASSRAIPVAKQLERIAKDPFIPLEWGLNQTGMQADQEADAVVSVAARSIWLGARDKAILAAEALMETGIHKQLTNRLLEPFMWHTVVVTATEWSNFFALRANPMAQPEIRRIAEMMLELYDGSTPSLVKELEWHLPFIQPEERDGSFEYSEEARKISAARCARVSYLTHDGRRDHSADVTLYERLVSGGHMSPLEHVATPRHGSMLTDEWCGGNFYGWKQFRKYIPNEHDFSLIAKSD